MAPPRALWSALDLAAMPTLAQQARHQPLPDGVLDVIRIAAGCDETLRDAVALSGRDPAFVKAAAEFYVQQVLLFSTAESHRVLGVRVGASREEMRQHMRWLMIWLHPDRAEADAWRSAFAHRVLAAWREVERSDSALPPRPASIHAAPRRLPAAKPRPAQKRRGVAGKLLLASLLLLVLFVLLDSGQSFGAQSWTGSQ